ncbi:MAG: glycosyltransferase [Anaerolineales bacterium]
METKRILILTADAGFGHRRAAEAVEAALNELYGERCQVDILNPLDEADAPNLIRQLEEGYDEMVIEDPALYTIAYHALDVPVVSDLAKAVAARLLDEVMLRILLEEDYDAIVSTYPTYAQPAARALRKAECDVPLAVVITDLTDVQRIWYSRSATFHFVPTKQIRQQAYENNIPATQIRVTGLPVHPDFSKETRTQAQLRTSLGWEIELTTAIIVASIRTQQMARLSRMLDRANLNLQLVVVCGGDRQLYETMNSEPWNGPVHIYDWVDEMPQLMKASDFVISKAGGLVVSESLACGLPMIIPEALPGQEIGNVRYVVENGAGAWAPGPAEVLVAVHSWLSGEPPRLAQMRENARELGKPRAAYEIAERVWGMA